MKVSFFKSEFFPTLLFAALFPVFLTRKLIHKLTGKASHAKRASGGGGARAVPVGRAGGGVGARGTNGQKGGAAWLDLVR